MLNIAVSSGEIVVSNKKLKSIGWEPKHKSAEAIFQAVKDSQ